MIALLKGVLILVGIFIVLGLVADYLHRKGQLKDN